MGDSSNALTPQVPSLVSRLSALHATLDSRVALHDRLLALNGRLELVVAQIDLQREANAPVASTSSAKPKPRRPVLRYVEGDSDLEDEAAMPVDDQGDIEDIALAATPSALDEDDSLDEDDVGSEDFEAEEPLRRAGGKANGFLDLEADDDAGDSSDDSDLDSEDEVPPTAFAGFDEDEDADGDADAAIVDDDDEDESASDDDA